MSKLSINESTLTAIGDAIREKTGKTGLIAPGAMPNEIKGIQTGSIELPEEAFIFTGDCSSKFANNNWSWFLDLYGNKITTSNITNAVEMFYNSNNFKEIPFTLNLKNAAMTSMFSGCNNLETIPNINCDNTTAVDMRSVFTNCKKLQPLPYIYNAYPNSAMQLFMSCELIREIPEDYFDTWNLSKLGGSVNAGSLFSGCCSLRKLPKHFIDTLETNTTTSSSSHPYNSLASKCYALDEITDLFVMSAQLTTNRFGSHVDYTHRLKNYTFRVNEDGTPYVRQWKLQTIDLSFQTGYCPTWSRNNVLAYNAGITVDKEVVDDATYQALKDDPDWFSCNEAYSRYNHDSAVATINSLPDTSAYGTNTIKFKGIAGSLTDGGAINTLTEEEIAVAAAKGWTVTLV